jgi:hypothetical protein
VREREQVLETDAVELPVEGEPTELEPEARPLPARSGDSAELAVWSGEVKSAALAAAGGLVAGAATVAVVRAARKTPTKPRRRGGILRRERPQQVIASRSFLVDVHLLGQK